jgi:hypothetical protein
LQKDLDSLGEWVAENVMKINPSKCKAVRKISHICAVFKVYSRERVWKAVSDRLKWPTYLSRVDHEQKIRNRRQTTDITL